MSSIKSRVALITGEIHELEVQIANELARAGAHIALGYRDRGQTRVADELAATIASAHGVRAIAIRADVSLWGDVDDMLWAVESELGEVGILVNRAPTSAPVTHDSLSLADWEQALKRNLTSAFLLAQRVLPNMRKARFGRVITLSRAVNVLCPQQAVSMAGLLGLTQSYANLLADEGITANLIEMSLAEADTTSAHPDRTSAAASSKLFREVCDIADMVVAIARNAYLTGQTLKIR